MISRRVLSALVTIGSVSPLALVIVWGVSRLLAAMQDEAGAMVLERIGLAIAVVWGIDLVALVLALGINSLGPPPGTPGE